MGIVIYLWFPPLKLYPPTVMKTAIVTDSTADVPSELTEILHIHVIPAIVMLGEQSFEDGSGITREEFYLRLPEMSQLPTTGTPAA